MAIQILNFPPFCLVSDHKNRLIVGGGGGEGRTGVPNKILLLEHKNGFLKLLSVVDTSNKAVMNMDIHPKESFIACGVDEKCRIYNVADKSLYMAEEIVTDFTEKEEDLGQKRVKFTKDGMKMVTSGGDGHVRIWNLPSLVLKVDFKIHQQPDITETVDLSLSKSWISSLTRNACKIIEINSGNVVHIIQPQKDMQFRDSRFSPQKNEWEDSEWFYTTEFIPQKLTIIKKWDTKNWKCLKSKTLKFKADHHTSFTLSPSGRFLAIGTVEGYIRIFSNSLSEIMNKHVHDFFVTDMVFEEKSISNKKQQVYLISCSGDNTIKSTKIKTSYSKILFFLYLLILMFFTYFCLSFCITSSTSKFVKDLLPKIIL